MAGLVLVDPPPPDDDVSIVEDDCLTRRNGDLGSVEDHLGAVI